MITNIPTSFHHNILNFFLSRFKLVLNSDNSYNNMKLINHTFFK